MEDNEVTRLKIEINTFLLGQVDGQMTVARYERLACDILDLMVAAAPNTDPLEKAFNEQQ